VRGSAVQQIASRRVERLQATHERGLRPGEIGLGQQQPVGDGRLPSGCGADP